jgi:hypothetical protein
MSTSEQLSSSTDTAIAERPVPKPELTGKHLEAYFIKGVGYHKQRILHAFGGETELQALPRGDLADTISASEKRYRKASDLLYREDPMEVPNPSDGISLELVVALADNLAWKGIEDSITTTHLDKIDIAVRQMGSSAEGLELKKQQKALKATALEDAHFYRDFFDSQVAEKLNLDSTENITDFLKRSSLGGDIDARIKRARGISLEIAAKRCVSNLLVGDSEKLNTVVSYGNSQEDAEGGDIVVFRGDKILYIDLKNTKPAELSKDEIENGYRLSVDKEKQIYKAVVWAESWDAVADENFRLTDPSLKSGLQQIVAQIS